MPMLRCTINVNTSCVSRMPTTVHSLNGFHSSNPGFRTTVLMTLFRKSTLECNICQLDCLVWKFSARWSGTINTNRKTAHNRIHIKLKARRLNHKTRPQQDLKAVHCGITTTTNDARAHESAKLALAALQTALHGSNWLHPMYSNVMRKKPASFQ